MTSKRTAPAPDSVVAYVRVSTDEQAASGAGLAAQRATIEAEAARRGWTITAWHSDEGISGKATANRPGLAAALADVEEGRAAALVVAKLDRLSRSVADASQILDRSSRAGWRVISCDMAVDTTTPAGEAAAAMMIVFSQLERRLISQRTKDALAAKRAAGVRRGRPSTLPLDLVAEIVTAHRAGSSMAAIARDLTDRGVPTARGGVKWYPSTVKAVLDGQDAANLAAV